MVLGLGETIVAHDYHTAGEPFRIVDLGSMEGATVLDRRSWAMAHLDEHRRFLVQEPRGHADMYGGMIVPPNDSEGDIGVVFFHKDGFSTACGHGTIATATWAIETGLVPAPASGEVAVVVDVPSGRLHTVARMVEGRVTSIRFTNVKSFVAARNLLVNTELGPVTAHISFGGAFYASVAIDDLPVSCRPRDVNQLTTLGREIKVALQNHPSVTHPSDPRLSDLYGTILHETVASMGAFQQRNVTVFADGQVDRSPCGSGTCARLALLHDDGTLGIGESFYSEGVAGGIFDARIEASTSEGITPSVEGSAYRHAISHFTMDPNDPIGLGFLFR
ncbi:MAG: proline racemase family protein [Acidimicrobiales bacterium]|nr:proline racemase family protein [Acidimicrobiales bacterium]